MRVSRIQTESGRGDVGGGPALGRGVAHHVAGTIEDLGRATEPTVLARGRESSPPRASSQRMRLGVDASEALISAHSLCDVGSAVIDTLIAELS